MNHTTRTASRVLFLSVAVVATVAVGQSIVAATGGSGSPAVPATSGSADGPQSSSDGENAATGGREPALVQPSLAAARDGTVPGENWSAARVRERTDGERNLTVVSTQGFYASDEQAELVAFAPDGSVVYYDGRYQTYFDVDPVPGKRYTVEYVASQRFSDEYCDRFEFDTCTRNVVNRVNLTTGEQRQVYAEVTPKVYSARWHDVDRWNETTLVVADIVHDGVYAVDVRDGSVLWRWNASDRYSRDQGGTRADWTHVNDVEILEDGRVVVSVRNMDSVVFLEPHDGTYVVNESWTLGAEDRRDTLYEQHNPDYIPPERGGPSVVVADSENGRVVEYHREDGEWIRTWQWRDARLQWPRDADRLPNGHTLVADTHGDRIVEVAPNGTIEWGAEVGMPYEVERIGTGDESTGGPAIAGRSGDGSGGIASGNDLQVDDRTAADRFWIELKAVTPSVVANGLLYVSPSWVRFTDLAFTAVVLVTGSVWGACEWRWSRYSLRAVARHIASDVGTLVRTVVPWNPDR